MAERGKRRQAEALRRVLVQIDFACGRDHFARIVVAAGTAHMVRALQLTAVRAFIGVRGDERIMGTTHVAARTGDSVLRNGHF
ncbi:hypothetical protein GCM10011345_14550 [Gemmobacter megaterium]|nr:hypothetical protein GCM10011345_14550 [Gemmobacter megaterium]